MILELVSYLKTVLLMSVYTYVFLALPKSGIIQTYVNHNFFV